VIKVAPQPRSSPEATKSSDVVAEEQPLKRTRAWGTTSLTKPAEIVNITSSVLEVEYRLDSDYQVFHIGFSQLYRLYNPLKSRPSNWTMMRIWDWKV
jgi:hypothetical protein